MQLTRYLLNPFFLVIVMLVFYLSGCNNVTQQPINENDKVSSQELIQANQEAFKKELQQIDDLVNRYGWKMNITGTGLRYLIYRQGNGKKSKPGDTAIIEYETRLITGNVVYSSNETGLKEFVIGKRMVEPGLDEGILLLRKDDQAKLIIPSHLAFGMTGDQDRIPPMATLVYDVKLIDLK